MSDQHGRDHEVQAELALDAEGRALAVRLTSFANLGAYIAAVGPLMATGNYVKNIQSNYATPLIEVNTRSILTNTTPVSAYRGAGRPEGNYYHGAAAGAGGARDRAGPDRVAPAQPHQAGAVPLPDRVRQHL